MDTKQQRNGSEALRVAQRSLDGVLVLALSGEVDLANVATLENRLRAAAQVAGILVIELTDLRYIDSCGIKALLDAHRFFERGGRAMALAALPVMMRRTFQILRIEQLMLVFPTVEAAVKGLRNGNGSPRTTS